MTQESSCTKLFDHRRFDRYLKAGPFLTTKQQLVKGICIPVNDSADDLQLATLTRKLRKKYLGRKLKYLSSQNQAIMLTHYSKYISNLTWRQPSVARVSLRSPKMEYPIENYLSVKSLEDFVMLDQDIRLNCKDIFRLILAYHKKTSIRITKCLSPTMSKWKKLPAYTKNLVKHLCLDVEHDDNHSFDRSNRQEWFKNFDQLNSFALAGGWKQPAPDLFTKLLQLKSLNTLSLDFDFLYSAPFITELYNEIEAAKIPKWHIRVRIRIKDIMHEEYDLLFRKIDCLAITKLANSYGGAFDFALQNSRLCLTHEFRNLQYLYANKKKVLELVAMEYDRFDIGNILDRCKSLEGLYIKANAYDSSISYNEPKKAAEWATHLKDVVLSYTQLSRNESVFTDLWAKIKNKGPKLETLELLSCYIDGEDDCYEPIGPSIIIDPDFVGFEKLTSLKYLKIATTLDFKSLEDIVSQLPNLKKLEVILGEGNQDVPFSSLGKIEKLQIKKVSNRSEGWEKEFLKNVPNLQGLQTLEFIDYTDETISLETLRMFIKGFISMKNIRKLYLGISVEKLEENQEENEILKEIKLLIQRYIETNKYLEEINIGRLASFGISRIKFTRY